MLAARLAKLPERKGERGTTAAVWVSSARFLIFRSSSPHFLFPLGPAVSALPPVPATPPPAAPTGYGAWRTRIMKAERRAALLIGGVYRWKKASYLASDMQEHALGASVLLFWWRELSSYRLLAQTRPLTLS